MLWYTSIFFSFDKSAVLRGTTPGPGTRVVLNPDFSEIGESSSCELRDADREADSAVVLASSTWLGGPGAGLLRFRWTQDDRLWQCQHCKLETELAVHRKQET
eukprot:1034584-Rhodomonas_salina.2